MLREGRTLVFRRIALMSLLPAVALSLAGCQSYPAPPTETFTPKIVGVIDAVTIDTSVRTQLTDGRIIEQPLSTAYHLFGGWGQPGWLLLADTSETGFTTRSASPGITRSSPGSSAAAFWTGSTTRR